jgi:signal recognition particle receptor subunit beta
LALLDAKQGVIVLRIVYDGPPGAGKTTSVRALGNRLGRPTTTPEELGGRTLYFDWLEYVGGQFDGKNLRCQIVSVPGQARFQERREYLLKSADAIVLVKQVTEANLTETLETLRGHKERVVGGAPVGVVLQANKSDHPDSLPLRDLRSRLEAENLSVFSMESCATLGAGVREAFVFAVRLALDRVEALTRLGCLPEGVPEIDAPDELLRAMKRLSSPPAPRGEFDLQSEAEGLQEASPSSSENGTTLVGLGVPQTAEPTLPQSSAAESTAHEPHTRAMSTTPSTIPSVAPPCPTALAPSGHVWPPVDGRITLAAATEVAPELLRLPAGFGGVSADGWRYFTETTARYESVDEGRLALLEAARTCQALAPWLSRPRCLVLAEEGSAWRLWQIARDRLSLHDRLAACDEEDVERLAALLLDTCERATRLTTDLGADAARVLVPTLESIGVFRNETQFVGFLNERPAPLDLLGVISSLAQLVARRRKVGRLVDVLVEIANQGGSRANWAEQLIHALRNPPPAAK